MSASLFLSLLLLSSTESDEVRCVVTHVSDETVFVDRGSEAGLFVGLEGHVEREGREIARVTVTRSASRSARLDILTEASVEIIPGDGVVFAIPKAIPESRERNDESFEPLLKPFVGAQAPRDVVRGRATLRSGLSFNRERDKTYQDARLSTSGTWDRLGGSRFALEWDIDTWRRSGSGYERSSNFEEIEMRLDLLSLSRNEETYRFAVGRVDPLSIPALGRLDGGAGEVDLSERFHVGIATGFRPDHETGGLRTDELVLAPWLSFETGDREGTYSATTLGLESTWFEGEADRRTVHFEERLDAGDLLRLRLSSEVDLPSRVEGSDADLQFSRFSVSGDFLPREVVSFYGRVHSFRRVDSLAERDSFREGVPFFDAGHIRYTLGTRQRLESWRFFEEISRVDGSGDSSDWQGRVGARRTDLFGVDALSSGLELFNSIGPDQSGLGAHLDLGVRASNELDLLFAFDSSTIQFDLEDSESLTTSALSLDASWMPSTTFVLSGRYEYAFGDGLDSHTLDLSLGIRF